MTGGTVVVLGRTGRNFAAGMSGGVAFVLDEDGDFAKWCNTGMVLLESVVEAEDRELLQSLIERHVRYTGSARGRLVLERFDSLLPKFVKVIGAEYKQVIEKRSAARQQANEELLEVAAH
jgi:glutamate synthase domain-containing protein 3